MANELYFEVNGDKEIQARFTRVGDAIRDQIRGALETIGAGVVAEAQSLAPVRTGKVRRSIRYKVTDKKTGDMVLSVRPAKSGWRGAFSEYPQKSAEATVRPYARKSSKGTRYGGASASAKRAKMKMEAQGIVFVKGYQRPVHLKFHPFMTPAYRAMRSQINDLLSAAMRQIAEAS